MVYVAFFVIFLTCIATLGVGIRILQSSRRSEALGEDRNELLRDQYERLEVLREERQVLIEELEGESRERRQLMEYLGGDQTQLADDRETESQRQAEIARNAQQFEQERLLMEQELHQLHDELEREQQTHLETQQHAERLELEHQQLTVDLQDARQQHSEAELRSEEQEQENAALVQELQRMKEEAHSLKEVSSQNRSRTRKGSYPVWRRIGLLAGLVLVVLVAWLTSLMVALSILSP